MRHSSRPRRALKVPRAAAIAGIIFAVLYGSTMVILYPSILAYQVADNTWLETTSGTVSRALQPDPLCRNLFLWFIGVIRDLPGDREDRLFSTVFLGSGLLCLASTFIGAALAGGLLNTYTIGSSNLENNGVSIYSGLWCIR